MTPKSRNTALFFTILLAVASCRTTHPAKSKVIHWQPGKVRSGGLELADADAGKARVVSHFLTRYERNQQWDTAGVIELLNRGYNGWKCTSYGSSSYEETGRDWNGQDRTFSLSATSDLNFFGNSNRDFLEFTTNSMNRNHVVKYAFDLACQRELTQREAQQQGTTVNSARMNWDCAINAQDFPQQTGEEKIYACSRDNNVLGTAFNFLTGGPNAILLQHLNDHKVAISVRKIAEMPVFDFNNCSNRNTKPFYLRITQGLSGWLSARKFRLNIKIDGMDSPKLDDITSTNGLYTLALAYCPATEQEHITVEMDAIEEDWFGTAKFQPANPQLSLRRGEVKTYELHQDKGQWLPTFIAGDESSFVRVAALEVD